MPGGQYSMAIDFFYIQCDLGIAFLSEGNFVKLTQLLCGQEAEKAWRAAPMFLFQTLWMKRNKKTFEDSEKIEQSIKLSFMNAFAEWVKLYVDVNLMSLIGMVNWISSQ